MSLNQQYAATLGDLLMRQADVQAESARERARIGNAKGQLWGNFLGGIAKLITEAPERDLQRQETAARIQQLGDISAARKAQAQQANDAAAGQEELASLLKDPQFGGDLQKVAGELNRRGRVGMATSLLKQASEQTTASNAMLTAKDAQRQRVADRLSLIDPNSQDDPYAALVALHQDGIDPSLLDEVTRAFDSMDTASAIKKFGATAPGNIAAKKAADAEENKIREINGAIGRGTDPANYSPINPKPEAPAPAKSLSQQLAEAKTPDEVKRITGLMRTEALARHVTDPKPSAGEQGVVDLSPAGLDAAAQMYAQTGQLPPMGMGAAAGSARTRIINRAAELFPGLNVASNKAGYTADSGSLSAIQKQRDSISAFENTAQKNIDQFLKVAQAVPDTGIPLLNTPARWAAGAAGSEAQAKYAAARQVAISEIAKIVQNPTLAGQLSDSARHEIEVFNPQNATLKQTVAVMNLLKQDMKNRADSLDTQLKDIRGRIGGAQGQNATPAAPAGSTGPQVGSVVTYNGKRYRVKSITNGRADLEAVQ